MLRIATAALSGRIYAGRPSKDNTHFVGNKTDVTSDVLKAIIDKVGPGNVITVEADGVPAFEIEVRRLGKVEVA